MDLLQRERTVLKVTTGSRALDELLGGGIETKSITEIYGEYRCGKSQVLPVVAFCFFNLCYGNDSPE